MDTIELTMDEIFEILFEHAAGDEIITAALEDISKPVSDEFLKQPLETCGGCGFFKIECQCPFKDI
jgi:hypothetical protein